MKKNVAEMSLLMCTLSPRCQLGRERCVMTAPQCAWWKDQSRWHVGGKYLRGVWESARLKVVNGEAGVSAWMHG
jgi:hypothetical protein